MKLSSLKKQFAARLKKVQTALYEDVTRAGWFSGRPDKVRGRWQDGGVVLAVAGGWLTYLLAQRLHWAPVGIALILVGLVLLAMARRMPARTARGSAVLAQARGFREYVRTAEAHQLRYEEAQDVFSRYLPYAVVFGETEHWVKVFGPLAAAAGAAAAARPGLVLRARRLGRGQLRRLARRLHVRRPRARSRRRPRRRPAGSGFSGGSSGGGGRRRGGRLLVSEFGVPAKDIA